MSVPASVAHDLAHGAVGSGVMSAHVIDGITRVDTSVADAVIKSFLRFLAPLKDNGAMKIASNDIISWDYSGIVPDGRALSGADLWYRVRMDGNAEGYRNPKHERELVELCGPDFARLAAARLPITSLGPGTNDAVVGNELPICRQIGADAFNAFDINGVLATEAADTVRKRMAADGKGIVARSYQGDFNRAWPKKLKLDIPMFATMLGGTLSQFDAHEFFGHFSNMTKNSSVLFFTADCNRVNPLETYRGETFRRFKENLWYMLKTVSKDPDFDPRRISYMPAFNGDSVEHTYVVTGDTTLTLAGNKIPFRQGTFITTGYSRRPTPESFTEAAKDTGSEISLVRKAHEGHVHGFFLVGDRFPHKDRLLAKPQFG